MYLHYLFPKNALEKHRREGMVFALYESTIPGIVEYDWLEGRKDVAPDR